VVRPEGFDLEEHWSSVMAEIDERRVPFRASAHVDPEAIPWLRSAFGSRLEVGESGADGRVAVELRSWSAQTGAGELAAFARWVEVVGPPEVRDALARLGSDLVALYGPAPARAGSPADAAEPADTPATPLPPAFHHAERPAERQTNG
jgi:hypothetical protein